MPVDQVLRVLEGDIYRAAPDPVTRDSGTSPLLLLTKTFTFADHAALKTGIDLTFNGAARPLAENDRVLNAWLEVDPDDPFDGTTPKGDVGTFIDTDQGFIGGIGGAGGMDLSTADGVDGGVRDAYNTNMDLLSALAVSGDNRTVLRVVAATAGSSIKVVATQNGRTSGTELDSAQGTATACALIIAAPA